MTKQSNPELDKESLAFIDSFGQLTGEAGLPPSIGRVLGLLVISPKDMLSAEEIGEMLQLSTGAVSTALSLLMKAVYVKRITVPGERRYYYAFVVEGWQSIIDARLAQIKQGIDLANAGLKIRTNDPKLLGMRSLYEQLYDSIVNIKVKY